MKLSEFYKERMAANPELTRRKLVDEIGSATVYALQHDVPRNFRKSTLQKLAELWKCSIGDIQACLAELPNPLRAEAAKPEGQAGISITAKKVPVKKDTEEPAPEKVPIKWHEDQKVEDEAVPDKMPRPGLTKIPADVNVEMYKSHLREMLVTRMAEIRMSATVADAFADFGRMVAQELI